MKATDGILFVRPPAKLESSLIVTEVGGFTSGVVVSAGVRRAPDGTVLSPIAKPGDTVHFGKHWSQRAGPEKLLIVNQSDVFGIEEAA